MQNAKLISRCAFCLVLSVLAEILKDLKLLFQKCLELTVISGISSKQEIRVKFPKQLKQVFWAVLLEETVLVSLGLLWQAVRSPSCSPQPSDPFCPLCFCARTSAWWKISRSSTGLCLTWGHLQFDLWQVAQTLLLAYAGKGDRRKWEGIVGDGGE